MRAFIAAVVLCAMAALAVVCAIVYLYMNYQYNWNSACSSQNGVKLENLSGNNICVRGPVQIVTIAVKPW